MPPFDLLLEQLSGARQAVRDLPVAAASMRLNEGSPNLQQAAEASADASIGKPSALQRFMEVLRNPHLQELVKEQDAQRQAALQRQHAVARITPAPVQPQPFRLPPVPQLRMPGL